MRSIRFSSMPLLILAFSLAIVSCNKPEDFFNTNTGDQNRKAIVKIAGAGALILKARDLAPNIDEFVLIEISRDPNSESDLNQPLTVKLVKDATLLPAGYIEIPTAAYTLLSDINNIVFAAGETTKEIRIKVDKSKLDLSKQYALGFKIADVGTGGQASADANKAVYSVVIKNPYHGTYHSSGVFHHPVNGDRVIDENKNLLTTGATSVRAPLGDLGAAGYYMILTVNPNNTVTITPSGVTPNIDQSWGPNYYDPATKSFHLFYSYNVAAPRKIEETITRQ